MHLETCCIVEHVLLSHGEHGVQGGVEWGGECGCGMHVGLNLMMCKFDVPLSPLQSLLLPYYSVWTHNAGGDCRKDVLARTICVSAVVFIHTAEFVLPS